MNRKRLQKMLAGMLAALVLSTALPAAELAEAAETKADIKTRISQILQEEEVKKASAKQKEEAQIKERKEKAAAAAQAKKKQPVLRSEPRYNYDWQGTPLVQTLYAISKMAGKKIVLNGELGGSVYTSLVGVTYDEALDYLGKTFNFNWMVEGDTILVSTSDLMLQSKRFDVKYANKALIKEELKALNIDEKNIYVNSEYNSVSVTGTPYQLTIAERRIKDMDKPVSQCLIVAQLIELSHGKNLDLGLKYTLPTYSHEASEDSDADNLKGNFLEKLTFSASAEANRALSKGKVVARPMVMTLNGQEALISMGDRVPVLTSTSTNISTEVTVEYQDIGSKLKVTPVIDKATGNIGLTIDTEISNIAKWITSGNVSAPQISSRKATTTAHLKSGQSLCIGGLMTTSELDNLSGIPGLMNLPILGKLFSYHSTSKENTEVFIMITPYIVDEGINPQQILRKEILPEGK